MKKMLPRQLKLSLKKALGLQKSYDYCLYLESVDYICNLRCEYCNIHIGSKQGTIRDNVLDFQALIDMLSQQQKKFLIIISGNGEPFLVPHIVDHIVEITKKHYVSIITNLTTDNIDEFCRKVSPKSVNAITASLHIKELERKNLFNKYVENFKLCQKKGFNIQAAEVAFPDLLPEINKYKDKLRQHGIKLGFNEFQGEYNGKQYPDAYTLEERKKFNLSLDKDSVNKFYQKGKKCNAGFNLGFVHYTGVVYPCMQIKKFNIGNLKQGIVFKENLVTCPFNKCLCPINHFNPYLFEKALNACKEK